MGKIKNITHKITRRQPTLQLAAEKEAQHVKALGRTAMKERMERINSDFEKGFKLVQDHPDTVTFFGSARLDENHKFYQQARYLANLLATELGVTIVTGGGHGIMEAANRGASEVEGDTLGLTIELPYEQVSNEFTTHSTDFYYFFSRKVALAFSARAFIYFPGGFGTMDEFFEMLVLKQTGKIKPIPIILVGKEYWQPLLDFIDTTLKEKFQTIDPGDAELYTLTDDFDVIVDIVDRTRPTERN